VGLTPRASRIAVKFGLIYELQMQKPWADGAEARTYHDALEQIELADKVGFDYVWEVEHHFLVEYSHSSAPEVLLAAASQRTKHVRLGHGIALLPYPFNHPIRVAERAAALDIISGGRVDLGTGRSITEDELGGFGIDPADSRPMWEEALRMIPHMWTEELFSWEGNYFVIPPRPVIPKPVQKPHPPLWVACTQPQTYEIAGRLGLGVLSFGFTAPGVMDAIVNMYRGAAAQAEPAGKFVNNQFAATTLGVCAPTDEEAIEIGRPAAEFFQRSIDILFVPWGGKANAPESYQFYVDMARREAEWRGSVADFDEQVYNGALVVGTPERCRAVVEKYAEAGVDQLILLAQAGRIPHEQVMQTVRLFGEEVIPHFK
jgi:alkanesulfonate monooxygenase SsuD/methylene tetrahydromethanopterin reductase-like flavin-dependent oxidoreductase (luciferase family)